MHDPFAVIIQTDSFDLQGVISHRPEPEYHIYDFTSSDGIEYSLMNGGDDNWIQVSGLILPQEIIDALAREIEDRYS